MRITLVPEGPSDDALTWTIRWIVEQSNVAGCEIAFADPRRLALPRPLGARLQAAHRLLPCDIAVVHRDADRMPLEQRRAQILSACVRPDSHLVTLVPVRMTETWLLFDEAAIRRAAGNPNGSASLDLPRLQELEGVAEPKQRLQEILLQAADLPVRRRHRFNPGQARRRIAELVMDWSPLRALSAFSLFERELRAALRATSGTSPSD